MGWLDSPNRVYLVTCAHSDASVPLKTSLFSHLPSQLDVLFSLLLPLFLLALVISLNWFFLLTNLNFLGIVKYSSLY